MKPYRLAIITVFLLFLLLLYAFSGNVTTIVVYMFLLIGIARPPNPKEVGRFFCLQFCGSLSKIQRGGYLYGLQGKKKINT